MVILSIFLGQLQGLHMDMQLDKKMDMENSEEKHKLEHSSQQQQMSQMMAMLRETAEGLLKEEAALAKDLSEEIEAEQKDVDAAKNEMKKIIEIEEGSNRGKAKKQ